MADRPSELIDKCIKGERKAQHELYKLYAPRLYPVCLRYTRSVDEAEDVLQEAFIKIFAKLESYRGESRFDYWMKRIVVNTALNAQRNKLYMYPMVDVTELNDSTSDYDIISDYSLNELISLVKSLPTGCQVVFNMFAIEGYSHKEISDELGISEGTSKSQYSRARKLLQEKIRKELKTDYGKVR